MKADRTLDGQMRALGVLQKNAGELGVASSRFRLPEESTDATRISGRLHTRLERIAAVHDFTSGLGLSAPQLGLRRAAVAVRTAAGDVTVLVNPRIVAAADETAEEYEGCLSFFSVRGLVRRSVAVEVEHQTIDGTYVVTAFAGRLARLVAHEVDHLRGILYTDRMTSSVSLIPVRDYRHQP